MRKGPTVAAVDPFSLVPGCGTDQEVVIPLLLAFGWRLAQLGLQDQLVSLGEERQGLGFGDLGQVGFYGLEVRDD